MEPSNRLNKQPARSVETELPEVPLIDDDGLLQFSAGDHDNPKNWTMPRRQIITATAVLMVVNATFASSSPSGCLPSIASSFQISEEAAGLTITVFLVGYCFGPLLWAPTSELVGRRWILIGTFIGYIAFNFLCAFTSDFGALLVGRFLTGTFAAGPLSNAPGVLADLWGPAERLSALAAFCTATFAGPALGPIISGALQVTEDYRWNFYVLLMLAAVTTPLVLMLPETLPSLLLMKKAERLRREKKIDVHIRAPVEITDRSALGIFKVAIVRPWVILIDPIAFLCAIYLTVVYTLLYMLFSVYPIVFQESRGWNPFLGELPLLGTLLGAVLAGILIFYEGIRTQRTLDTGNPLKPESLLYLGMIGGILFPLAMFWFSWTAAYPLLHWMVPTVAGVFLALSILLIYVAFLNYVVESYLLMAASALAGNTIIRSAVAASAPLWTHQMYAALGIGGGGSLVAGVGCLLAPVAFLFSRYGEQIRIRSKFAPTASSSAKANPASRSEKAINEAASDEQAGVP